VKTCRIMEGVSVETASREEYLRRGRRLEYFTIAYNSLKGVCSIVAGLIAGSVSLVGFGLDSMIEVASGAALSRAFRAIARVADWTLPPELPRWRLGLVDHIRQSRISKAS